ncbi:lipoprotein [Marinobacter sp. KMM 10035]|uniref:LPS translocon maturation chaperone LptM n=1 Tax=uncultured Marinobacter sp. TaxID=187379 RepID=UPI00261F6534|nr:lipoprotein [Marinobacter sp. F26243]
MRVRNMPIVILVVAAALGGCGQKGPLYRENPETSSKPVEQANSAVAQSGHAGGRSTRADTQAE